MLSLAVSERTSDPSRETTVFFPVSTTEPTPSNDPTATPNPRAEGGKLAGCYVLVRRLEVGEGAEVWLAQDEVLGKDVSLHFIPDAVRKDSRALQELRHDIKRNRQLIHPNILRVYDLVEEPEWVAISMEAFDGESLAQRLARQSGKGMKVAEVQGWAEQLAQTLEEAHKISVLHLDLAPSNVFFNSAGKLSVANFGISRTLRDALARSGASESPEAAYQSPQRLEGNPPARADDIYALGAVLYAAVAGQAPFVGQDVPQQIRSGMSAQALAALRKGDLGLPESWAATIAACLDKNPEARPTSAEDVARRLKAVSSSEAPAPAKSPAPEVVAAAAAAAATAPAPTAPSKPANVERPAAELASVSKPADPVKEPQKEPESSKAAPPKAPERPPISDFKPRLYPEQSRFPLTGLAAAAAVIVIIVIIYQLATGKRTAESTSGEPQPEKAELRALSPSTPPADATVPAPDAPIVKTTSQESTPAPVVTAAVEGPAKVVAEKMASLEKAKQAAQSAEKTYAELQQQQKLAETELAAVQASLDEKTKAAGVLKKAAEEAAAQRVKMEEEQKSAEATAAEAQKVALEKTRLAEEAKNALAELEKVNAEKLTAPQKAEMEMTTLQTTLTEKQQKIAESAKALAEADMIRQQNLAAVTQTEQEIERFKSADMETQRKREAAETQKSKLDQELAEMQRLFKEKMADLEAKRKLLENPTATPATEPLPQATLPAATPSVVTPSGAARPAAATPEPVKLASIPATPAPPVAPDSTPTATGGAGGNSLGLKFVPVGDVEFSIWQTRVKDFEVFAKAVNLKSNSWKGPGFKQGPDHPVVNVSWQEAIAFCKWLTDKEHKEGTLPRNQFYRLPTDLEWSRAVGLSDETGKTPEVRDMGVPDEYPWGKAWPPPAGAGNYTGEETGSDVAIRGYDDGFAWTSPVGSFPPNELGLFDMGGNVWQWCMDAWNDNSKAKVLRGASWYNGALKLSLLSSCRVHAAPDSSTDNYGFRIVRASEPTKSSKK